VISRRLLFGTPLALSLPGCQNSVRTSGYRLELTDIERLHVQVSFTTPTQPTGVVGFISAWDIFVRNAQEMLPLRLRDFSLEFDAQQSVTPSDYYSEEELIELSRSLRRLPPDPTTGHLHVLFVLGALDPTEEGSPYALANNDEALIVVFVDPLNATPNETLLLLQQFSLVHELGHIVGLVNAEVPMVQAHEDTTYSGHCTEFKCVMRSFSTWESEWISQIYRGELPVIIGPQCRTDLREHYGESSCSTDLEECPHCVDPCLDPAP
jgi:hypothetical protein